MSDKETQGHMDPLLKQIVERVGPCNVLTDDKVATRRVDWLTGAPCRARAIIRPGSTDELAAVMHACHAARQPVVTHGGLTGLVNGAEAGPDELVISLERMNTIEAVDPVGGSLIAQAGTPLQRVQEAAEEVGLQFPLDLGARGSCTIGGNIATNAGGVRVIRYGMMRQQVLGLEAVLADGRVIGSMNQMLKNNTGYDLKQLFIGSEGTLGIITRAVLRLQPATPDVQTALVACPDFTSVANLLTHMGRGLGGNLAAFEAMWQNHFRLLTVDSDRHPPPLAPDSPFYVIIESLGNDHDSHANQFAHALEMALEQELISDAVLAQSNSQRRGLWAIREDIEGLAEAMSPFFAFDVSLPIPAMESYVAQVEATIHRDWPDGRVITFGHLGDSNLHLSVSVGSADRKVRCAVEEAVYGPLALLNGSISAEHGIGLEKRDFLSVSRSKEEIALMRTLKLALDPLDLLNRHKVLPSGPE